MTTTNDSVYTILRRMKLEESRAESIIQKREKAAWKVIDTASNQLWVLKKSPKSLQQWQTIRRFCDQMRLNGAPLPIIKSLIPATRSHGTYLLMQWVGRQSPNVLHRSEMIRVVHALAKWHRASQLTLQKSSDAQKRALPSLLGTWAHRYDKRTQQLENYIQSILTHRGTWGEPDNDRLARRWIQKNAEKWLQAARKASAFFHGAAYQQHTKIHRLKPSICHQDFSQGNLRIYNDKIYALDVDGLTIDSPIRDIRKLYIKIASDRGWHGKWSADVWQAYSQILPLDQAAKEILRHDLQFPHRFFGWCKAVHRAIHQPQRLRSPRRAGYHWLQQLINEESIRLFGKIEL